MRMTTRRSAVTALAALALSAITAEIATAASNHRYQNRYARFTAVFEAKRTVQWNEPRWQPYSDCYHQRYTYANGHETWTVKSKPTKVMFANLPPSKLALLMVGTWDPMSMNDSDYMEAAGMITRDAFRVSGWNPGSCGGPPGLEPARDQKCGSRLPRQLIYWRLIDGKLSPEIQVASVPPIAAYDDCEIYLPRLKRANRLLGERDWPLDMAGKLPNATVFGPRKTLTIASKRAYADVQEVGAGASKVPISADLSWTLTLTRTGKR